MSKKVTMRRHISTRAMCMLIPWYYFVPTMASEVDCGGEPCLNGGTCMESEDLLLMCRCRKEFFGSHCQLKAGDGETTTFPLFPEQGGFSDSFTLSVVGNILGFAFLGLVCFVCISKMPRSNSTDHLPTTSHSGYGEVAGDFIPRERSVRSDPGIGEYNAAYAAFSIEDVDSHPPSYASLDLPPPYSAVVKDYVRGTNAEGCGERNANEVVLEMSDVSQPVASSSGTAEESNHSAEVSSHAAEESDRAAEVASHAADVSSHAAEVSSHAAEGSSHAAGQMSNHATGESDQATESTTHAAEDSDPSEDESSYTDEQSSDEYEDTTTEHNSGQTGD